MSETTKKINSRKSSRHLSYKDSLLSGSGNITFSSDTGISFKSTNPKFNSLMSSSEFSKNSSFIITNSFLDKLLYQVAKDDFLLMKYAIQLFPLKFRESYIENQYCCTINKNLKPRLIILGSIGSFTVLLLLIGYILLYVNGQIYLPTKLNSTAFLVFQSIALIISVIVGISPFLPKINGHLEMSLNYLFSTLFVSLITGFYLLAVNLHKMPSISNALCVKIWSDANTFILNSFGILIYSCLIQNKTSNSIYVVAFITHCTVILFVIQAIRICRVEPLVIEGLITEKPINHFVILSCILQSICIYTMNILGFSTRFFNELIERVEIYRYLKGEEYIDCLSTPKKYDSNIGISPIEDIMSNLQTCLSCINNSGLIDIKAPLKEAQKLLNITYRRVSKVDKLFSINLTKKKKDKYDEKNVKKEYLEENYYEIFANVTFTNENQLNRMSMDIPLLNNRNTTISRETVDGLKYHFIDNQPEIFDNLDHIQKKCNESVSSNIDQYESLIPTLIDFSLMKKIDEFVGFDMDMNLLELQKENSNLFFHIGVSLFLRSQFFVKEDQLSRMIRFVTNIGKLYMPNPYHNELHGAMVAHSCLSFMNMLQLYESNVTFCNLNLCHLIITIAGLCHDIGHCGRSNSFLVKTGNTIATLYNDQSVLENYHSCITFELLSRPQCNILMGLGKSDTIFVRQKLIEMILATDMSNHFEIISRFRIARKDPEFNYMADPNNFWAVTKICIKAADLSHSVVKWDQHLQWSLMIAEEFYQQGSHEGTLGLNISPLCDIVDHNEFTKSQQGFLDFIVFPLMTEIEELHSSLQFTEKCIANLKNNRIRWESLCDANEYIPIPKEIKDKITMKDEPSDVLYQTITETIKILNQIDEKKKSVTYSNDIILHELTKEENLVTSKPNEVIDSKFNNSTESLSTLKSDADLSVCILGSKDEVPPNSTLDSSLITGDSVHKNMKTQRRISFQEDKLKKIDEEVMEDSDEKSISAISSVSSITSISSVSISSQPGIVSFDYTRLSYHHTLANISIPLNLPNLDLNQNENEDQISDLSSLLNSNEKLELQEPLYIINIFDDP